MGISARLMAVADMVPPCGIFADIGTDHAALPIYLVSNGICETAIASDVAEGPLERASENIMAAGLSDRITVRLSDGLLGFCPGEAQVIAIAGMGGALICEILKNGFEAARDARALILSPHSEPRRVRKFLLCNGYVICDETMARDAGRYYNVIKAEYAPHNTSSFLWTEAQLKYGKHLIERRTDIFCEYMEHEAGRLEALCRLLERQGGPKSSARLAMLKSELSVVKEVMGI